MTNKITLTDAGMLLAPETTIADGCPVLTKLRHITTRKGVAADVLWPLRGPEGQTIDLSQVLCTEDSISSSIDQPCSPGRVVIRFMGCDERLPLTEIDGYALDAAAGQITFSLPSTITDLAGIYRMEAGVLNSEDRVIYSEDGLLSVERGQFGNTLEMTGPPTLNEIRMAMRDSAGENNLLDACEFSADEVIFSVMRPIAEWNETIPDVRRFNCHTFPWRELWLKGIMSYLLQTAVFHYTRNKLNASHGGLTVADKDKDREYQGMAQMFREEWLRGMRAKKLEINIALTYGEMRSGYAGTGITM
jgi:hypothetical protein